MANESIIFRSMIVNPIADGTPVAHGGGMTQMLIFVLIFVGMWFLLIAPNRRRQKIQRQMLKGLKVGDRVLLSSGIFAKIIKIKGAHLLVEMSRGVRMEILRGHVQQLADSDGESEVDADEEKSDEDKSTPVKK